MHDQPDGEIEAELLRQDREEIRIPSGEVPLTDANPEAGADRRELREIAVAAQGEELARERHAEGAHAAD